MLPEEEDIEWHSNRISLPTDPYGLQDPGVPQLAADQVILKHAWLLSTDVQMLKYFNCYACSVSDQTYGMVEGLPSYYLA